MRGFTSVFVAFSAFASVIAHPVHQRKELTVIGRDQSARVVVRAEAANTGLDILSGGNEAFRKNLAEKDPQLLQKLADDGQGKYTLCSIRKTLTIIICSTSLHVLGMLR